MVFDETDQGLVLRVRLTPNAATAGVKGLFKAAEGEEYLKINVRAVPEKNKANRELLDFLARETGIAKSCWEVVGGATDRYKRILLSGEREHIKIKLQHWLEKALSDD